MMGAETMLPPVLAAIDRHGLKLDPKAQRLVDRVAEIAACYETPSMPEVSDLLAEHDVGAAIDCAVRGEAERPARLRVVGDLAGRFAGLALQAIRESAGSHITAMQPRFAKAAKRLADAAAHVTVEQAGGLVTALHGDARAVKAYEVVRETSAELDDLLNTRALLTGQPVEVDQVVASFGGDWWAWTDASEAFDHLDRCAPPGGEGHGVASQHHERGRRADRGDAGETATW